MIADCTTARSRAPTALARRNFLQKLSVSLWTSNARIILRYWTLQSGDSDFASLNA